MIIKTLNGTQLEAMLRSGTACLRQQEDRINRLNVFPVADGDTGTNMLLTMQNGINSSQSQPSLCGYLKELSHGLLLGARGNSGVLLSQFFAGFYRQLAKCDYAGVGQLRNALTVGYRTAYKAMVHPVEGTVLTVMREGINNIRSQITRRTTVTELFAMYVAECKKSLSQTTAILDVLAEANVVDSGALGFICIFEGCLMELYGKPVTDNFVSPVAPKAKNTAYFGANSEFTDGYCMEFILQLMNNPKYNQRFKIDAFSSDLTLYGNSVAAVQDGTRVKVHIHTHYPARVISAAQEFGEFVDFKLENMQLQHNERDSAVKPAKSKSLATIAAVNGGFDTVLKDLGLDVAISADASLNVSAEQFASAISSLDAQNIVVFPCSRPSVAVALQAAELCGREGVTVIPTDTVAECYFALALDLPDDTAEQRISAFKSNATGIITLCEATASKDFALGKCGDEVVLMGGEPIASGDSQLSAIINAFKTLDDVSDRETCVVFKGVGADDIDDALTNALLEINPMLDVTVINSSQELYHWFVTLP